MISDIDPSTPTGQDLVLNGDNQIRALKNDIKSTLGGLNAPVYEDADSAGAGGATLLSAATMSSWEARIAALESLSSSPSGTSVPVGGILIWHGASNTIPTGWKVCNGTTYQYTLPGGGTAQITTPDLRGRFICGPDAADGPVQGFGRTPNWDNIGFGPQVLQKTGFAGTHTHTVSTNNHTLQPADIPAHAHAMFVNSQVGAVDRVGFLEYAAVALSGAGDASYDMSAVSGNPAPTLGSTGATGSGNAHNHGTSTSSSTGSHEHDIDVAPPYLSLYYIMYVADGTPV